MLDYMTLRFIWWALLGVLLVGFAIMDGFDFGVAMLHPFVARNDLQRRVTLNTIGPVWEGNQVWFILGGGAVFAAFPLLYAVSFSGFYLAMLLLLLALILRPVAIGFRGKAEARGWRMAWDWLFFLSGLTPALLFGVAFGNLLLGAPFRLEPHTLRSFYEGGLVALLTPFAVLCGAVSVFMMLMQGAAYLSMKTEGDIAARSRRIGAVSALLLAILFTLAGFWVAVGIDGYLIVDGADPNGASNPVFKTVVADRGAWLYNYAVYKWPALAPLLAYAGALAAAVFLVLERARRAFVASSVACAGIVTTAGVSMFPFLLPSSTHPNDSLTIWDASSSQFTLGLMLVAAVFFLPIILAYTSWVFYVLRGPVTERAIERGEDYFY